MSKEERNPKIAAVWVDSFLGLQYKYKSALIRAAEDADAFRQALAACPESLPAPDGREWELLAEKGIEAVPIWDARYPERLLHLPEPPLVLYARGNLSLLGERCLAIVGSRRTPGQVLRFTEDAARELSRRFAVVTGIAEGADKAAIRGSLDRGRTVCVLPLGFGAAERGGDAALAEKIAERGLLITERPYRAVYEKNTYYLRNRVIAALSEGVLVAGAGKKSGALITANYALELGREVFALPYGVGAVCGEGCNALIKAGAALVTDPQDVYDAFHMTDYRQEDVYEGLGPAEREVLAAVREEGQITSEELAARAGLPLSELLPALSLLELKGRVVRLAGNVIKSVK